MVFRKSHAAESVIPFARGNITLVVTGVAGSVHLEHPGGFAVRQQTDAAGPLGQIEIVLVVGDQQTGGVEARGEQRTEIMLPRDTGASGKGRNVGFDGVGEEGFESLFIELQIPPPPLLRRSPIHISPDPHSSGTTAEMAVSVTPVILAGVELMSTVMREASVPK